MPQFVGVAHHVESANQGAKQLKCRVLNAVDLLARPLRETMHEVPADRNSSRRPAYDNDPADGNNVTGHISLTDPHKEDEQRGRLGDQKR
jgi:hypothetical protein